MTSRARIGLACDKCSGYHSKIILTNSPKGLVYTSLRDASMYEAMRAAEASNIEGADAVLGACRQCADSGYKSKPLARLADGEKAKAILAEPKEQE